MKPLSLDQNEIPDLYTAERGDLSFTVYKGQLVSIQKAGIEYLHGAGKPSELKEDSDERGYFKSEIFCFPIFGAVPDFKVSLGNKEYSHDLHGTSPNIPWEEADKSDYGIVYKQTLAGLNVKNLYAPSNPLYAGTERPDFIEWPHPFTIEKRIEIIESGIINVSFSITNDSDRAMPYTSAWHPGFRVNTENGTFVSDKRFFSVEDVIKQSDSSIKLEGESYVTYMDTETRHGIDVSSKDFSNFMVWIPPNDRLSGMACIEAISNFPDPQKPFFTGWNQSALEEKVSDDFRILKAGETVTYSIALSPF